MHFENDSIEELKKFINSSEFLTIEISRVIAESLIKRCEEHGLVEEIKIIKSVTIKTSKH